MILKVDAAFFQITTVTWHRWRASIQGSSTMRLPTELLEFKQWVLWRKAKMDGRITKQPISPWSGKLAACDRPKTWSSYRHVLYAMRRHVCDGIGFVFTETDPFCGIDLDHCRTDDGAITLEAQSVISRLGSYTEISPSGAGIHLIVRSKLPCRGRRNKQMEIYDSGRYFTITGERLVGTSPNVQDRQIEIDAIITEQFASLPRNPLGEMVKQLHITDAELIKRAMNARNGERFCRLWGGDTSDYDNDHSRADSALCCMLAYWTGRDNERLDRLFRRSGLMRQKWDRPTGNSSYSELTIESALASMASSV
jgi:putative DNA primase/helicase